MGYTDFVEVEGEPPPWNLERNLLDSRRYGGRRDIKNLCSSEPLLEPSSGRKRLSCSSPQLLQRAGSAIPRQRALTTGSPISLNFTENYFANSRGMAKHPACSMQNKRCWPTTIPKAEAQFARWLTAIQLASRCSG